jgi:hypothetical protein
MANWKKISLAGAIVLCVGIGLAAYLRPQPQPVPQQTAPQQTAADKDLVLQGRAYCAVTVPLETPVLENLSLVAKVAEVLVGVGQAVKQDQPLLRLDLLPADAAKMIERANKGTAIHTQELLVQKAELELSKLERNIQETRKLEEVGLAPRNSLPSLLEQKAYTLQQIAEGRQIVADLRRNAAEDLKVMSDLLGYPVGSGSQPRSLIVRAKQDGIIIGIEANVTPGTLVKGKVMTLGVMDPMVIRGQVHESEIGRLRAGDSAQVTLDSADKDEPAMNATLTSVSWAAQDSSLSAPAYYLFELQVPNPKLVIRDGTKVQVTFKAKQKDAAGQPAPQPAETSAPAKQQPNQVSAPVAKPAAPAPATPAQMTLSQPKPVPAQAKPVFPQPAAVNSTQDAPGRQ